MKNSETNIENQQDLEKRERNEGQYDEETTLQKEQDNISEIFINKELKSEEIISNDKLNVKVNSISQVKKISNELIQDNNYHTNLTKLEHGQTEQSQPIKLKVSETNTESKDKEGENQTKKLEREEIITYTTENIKNNRKDSTEKYGRNRVQYFEERIEELVAERKRSIQTRAKQKEQNGVTKEVSNSQLQKETLIRGEQRKKKAEEPKYKDRSVEINRTKKSNYNENKTENHNVEKEQQNIKNENCMKCDKYIETVVQRGYSQRWFHFKCEGATKEKVMQEYPEEMQYV